MLMAHACYSQSMYITTAYDTLGEEGLTFSLNECEIATLFTQADLLPMVKKIGGAVPTLKNIIYTGKATDDQINALKAAHPHLTVHSLEEVRQLGARNPVEPIPPKPEDLCCIMYTSGSTGNPKGVMLTHAAILGVVAAAELIFGPYLGDNDDVMLAFLPLAHVLEFALEHVSMYLGMAIGYGGVRTLTDSSVRNCKGDIRELRPTFMAGVPAVWETIRKGVMAKLNEAKSTQRAIFDMAFNLKWFLLQMGMPTGFLDAVVFKAVQQQTGGRLKLILSGGAPLPPESHKFITVCVCPLVQGYGLTETCGPLSVQTMMEIGTVGTVGAPLPSVELKLVAVEETAYTPFPDDPNVNPRGEVWARGSSIMSGYYKQPQLTAEVLTDDGWFKTGDIGEWMPDGALRIIDRKKNLVKLSNGEYVAIEKLESQYKTSAFVANICIYADSLEAFVVGIVVPIEKELRTLAKSLSLFNTAQHEPDFAELCAHPEIIKKVLEDIRSAGRRANFKPAELVHTITLIPEEWTPQNGMLTAAQKIKRPEIAKKYAAAIKKMYNKKN
nr:long-chain fatty acid-CoA ligase [Polyrhizophydium stewartii]